MGYTTNGNPKVPTIRTTALRHSDMAVGFIVMSLYMAGENTSI
jgi:hypothetical protein